MQVGGVFFRTPSPMHALRYIYENTKNSVVCIDKMTKLLINQEHYEFSFHINQD
jgi:hypothetical protein